MFCLITLVCLTLASTSWATNYYVDQNNAMASDSNPGTESSPWKTIQKGANVAVAGDTVYVKSGIYHEWVNVKNSGTEGNPITFKAYPGDKPIIDGTGVAVPTYEALFWSRGNNYITLDGFEVRNSSQLLIGLNHGNYLTIKNCVAHGNSGPGGSDNNHDGILIGHCNYGLVENTEVYDSGHDAFSAESTNYVIFQNNYAHDNPNHVAYNIFPATSETQTEYSGNNVINNIAARCSTGVYMRFQKDNIISGNLFYKNGGGGIYLEVAQNDSHTYTANTQIYNNTVADNGLVNSGTYGISDRNGTNVTIHDNIVINNGTDGAINIASGATPGTSIAGNLYDTSAHFGWGGSTYSSFSSWVAASGDSGSIEGNWQFADRSAGDYTLTNNSTDTIGKGVDMTSVGISAIGTSTTLAPPYNLRASQ